MEVANGLLLATAWTYDSAVSAATGIGLAAYSLDGTPRFHILAGPVASIQAGAGMAYVRWPENPGDEESAAQISVVDLATGQVVRTLPNQPVFLLAQ